LTAARAAQVLQSKSSINNVFNHYLLDLKRDCNRFVAEASCTVSVISPIRFPFCLKSFRTVVNQITPDRHESKYQASSNWMTHYRTAPG
jgi:hypothetical protein